MAGQLFGMAFYECQGTGWSEIYWSDKAGYAPVLTDLDLTNTSRMAMFLADVSCVGLRVSDNSINGDAMVSAPTTPLGTYVPADPGNITDYPANGCLARIEAGALYRGMRILRGIPADLTAGGHFSVPLAWQTAFTAWGTNVKTLFGLYVKEKGVPDPRPKIFQTITAVINLAKQRTHRVGRPFGLLRGRRLLS
jgi:hypothetical protein